MVHIAVPGLIQPHDDDDMAQTSIGAQLPTGDGELRCRYVFCPPCINLGQIFGVALNRLLFQIADKPVSDAWPKQVEHDETVEEDALCYDDQGTFKPIGFGDLNEGHQMSAFILGLVQQRSDPAAIILKPAQGLQVGQHAANHAGHGSDCFQHNRTVAIAMPGKRISKARQEFHRAKGDVITQSDGLVICDPKFRVAVWHVGFQTDLHPFGCLCDTTGTGGPARFEW
jgi:hypothetical protein